MFGSDFMDSAFGYASFSESMAVQAVQDLLADANDGQHVTVEDAYAVLDRYGCDFDTLPSDLQEGISLLGLKDRW